MTTDLQHAKETMNVAELIERLRELMAFNNCRIEEKEEFPRLSTVNAEALRNDNARLSWFIGLIDGVVAQAIAERTTTRKRVEANWDDVEIGCPNCPSAGDDCCSGDCSAVNHAIIPDEDGDNGCDYILREMRSAWIYAEGRTDIGIIIHSDVENGRIWAEEMNLSRADEDEDND